MKLCVDIIGTFLQQKLKLSIKPYALDEMSKMAYYERGGKYGEPAIAVISSNDQLPEKPPLETNFWYLSALHSHNVHQAGVADLKAQINHK